MTAATKTKLKPLTCSFTCFPNFLLIPFWLFFFEALINARYEGCTPSQPIRRRLGLCVLITTLRSKGIEIVDVFERKPEAAKSI